MQTREMKTSFISQLDEMKGILRECKSQEAILLTLGAGAISKKARELVKEL
jgi:UDP-N-acetylmuramate-alanine ligase